MTPSRILLFAAILVAEFALFEAGLRLRGGSEASPVFQQLFMNDPAVGGYRLRPGARAHYRTAEFETDISINSAGVRDAEFGPKTAGERRIVVLGDSLVMSVQVRSGETFCARLQDRLNAARRPGDATYRVINAGVQGYGPVEELEFFDEVARRFDPDVVLVALFVGNDAMEAADAASRLDGAHAAAPAAAESRPAANPPSRYPVWLRRVTRRSMVAQIVRLRVNSVVERFGPAGPIDRALTLYLPVTTPEMERGLAVTREAVRRIAAGASDQGARTGIVLLPARFQVADDDFERLREIVAGSGEALVRDAATVRFEKALAPLSLPTLDALPVLRDSGRRRDVFFQDTVHLTVTGHEVLAAGLERFLRESGLLAPSTRARDAGPDRTGQGGTR